MALAVLTCFLIPFEIAFETTAQEEPALITVNSLIDVFFVADIILNFRTSYVSSKTGKQVTLPSEICRNYCMGWFWLDFVSTIPFDRVLFLLDG